MSQSPPLNLPSYLTPPVYLGSSPPPYILISSGYPVSPGVFPLSSTPPPPFLSPSSYRTPVLFTPTSVCPIPPIAHQPSPSQWVVPSTPNPSTDSPISFESAPSLDSSPQTIYPDTPSSQPFPSEFLDYYSQTHSSPECKDCRLEKDEEYAIKDQTKTSPISRQEALAEVKLSGKLFVGGLTKTTTAEQLKDFFSQFGSIIECFVKRFAPCESRGFGFVTYAHPSKIEEVLSAGPLVLNDNTLDVRLAIPRHLADIVDITLGCRKIFVGGLSKKTDDSVLQEYFSTFGSVQQVLLLKDPNTGRHRGFAFITFEDYEIAERVCNQNPHKVGNRLVDCKMALPKADCRRVSLSPPSTPPSSSGYPNSHDSPDSSGRDYLLFSPPPTNLQVSDLENSSSSVSPPWNTFPITYAFHSAPSPVTSQTALSYFPAAPAPHSPATPSFTYSSAPLSSPFLPITTPSPFLQTPHSETDFDDSYFRFDVASLFYPMSASPSSVVLSPVAPSGVGSLTPPPHPPSLLHSSSYFTIPTSLSSYGSPVMSATNATNAESANVLPSPSMITSFVQNSYHPEIWPQCLVQNATDVNVLCQDFSNFSLH